MIPLTLNRRVWIVVADKSRAILFQRYAPGEELQLLQRFDHPEGRLKPHEIDADKPGRSFGPGKMARHSYDSPTSPGDRAAIKFAQVLASILERGLDSDQYDWLVLVAEPRLLGLLKRRIRRSAQQRIVRTVSQGLHHLKEHQVQDWVEKHIKTLDSELLRKAG